VIEAMAPVVAPYSLETSARVLRDYGNMSSPSVLFVLEEALKSGAPNGEGDFWLVSFGAGFRRALLPTGGRLSAPAAQNSNAKRPGDLPCFRSATPNIA